jgi:hypothetical protein
MAFGGAHGFKMRSHNNMSDIQETPSQKLLFKKTALLTYLLSLKMLTINLVKNFKGAS